MNYSGSIFLSLALLLPMGCSKKNQFIPPPSPEVTVRNPEQKTVTIYREFPGRLAAFDEVAIRARVKGFLKTIDFIDGQRVEQDDLLFTIEPEQYLAAIHSAEAKLAQAGASLKLAVATLKRVEKAYETHAVSEISLLSARAEKESAEAEVMAADAALDNAKLEASYTEIRAPMAGRLSRRALSIGNLVGDNEATLLTTLVVEAPINLFFNVDERTMLPFLHAGGRNMKPGEGIPPVKLQLADGTTHGEEGIIDYTDPQVDPATGTLRARAVFPNQGVRLIPGLFGNVLISKILKDAILVPEVAIQRDMTGAYVLVVDAGKQVERRSIERGPQTGTDRVVTKGLATSDQVIIEGIQRARPGITVRIASEQAEPLQRHTENGQE